MEIILFGCRKENVFEREACDYTRVLGDSLLSSLGFSLERTQSAIVGGLTRTYRDAGGSEVEHFNILTTPNLNPPIPVHVNVFHVRSYPERVREIFEDITKYSQDLGYAVRRGIADSLSLI